MNTVRLFSLVGAGLFALGLHGLATQPDPFRKVLAANVMGHGVFLLLVALARRGPGAPDPVPHAMVLTGIVVAVSVTAFALGLVRRIHESEDEDEDVPERDGPDRRSAS